MNSTQMARLRQLVEDPMNVSTCSFLLEGTNIKIDSRQRQFYDWMDHEVATPLREFIETKRKVNEAFSTLMELSAPKRLKDKDIQNFITHLVTAKTNKTTGDVSGVEDKDQGRLMKVVQKKLLQAVEMGDDIEVSAEDAKSAFDKAVGRISKKVHGGEDSKLIKGIRGIQKYVEQNPKKTAIAVSIVSIAAGAFMFPGAGAIVGAFLRAGVGVIQGKDVKQAMKSAAIGATIGALGGAAAGGVLDNVLHHATSATPAASLEVVGLSPGDVNLGAASDGLPDIGSHDVSDLGTGGGDTPAPDADEPHGGPHTSDETDPIQLDDGPNYEVSKLAKPGSHSMFHGHKVEVPADGAKIMDYDMSFKEAFRQARKEFGPGKAFEWHGKLFNTYLKSEI